LVVVRASSASALRASSLHRWASAVTPSAAAWLARARSAWRSVASAAVQTGRAALLLGAVGGQPGAQVGDLGREVERLAPSGARGRSDQRDHRDQERVPHRPQHVASTSKTKAIEYARRISRLRGGSTRSRAPDCQAIVPFPLRRRISAPDRFVV
jgi:hypothetical protein